MSPQSFYFTRHEYEYFTRIFNEAEELPWVYEEDGDCYRLNAEFDPPSSNIREFAKKYPICLRKLKTQLRKEPPSSFSTGSSAFNSTGANLPGDDAAVERGPSPVGLVLCAILFLLACVSLFMYRFSAMPDAASNGRYRTAPPKNESASPVKTPSEAAPERETVEVVAILDKCKTLMKKGCLTECDDGNALDCYRNVLHIVPDNAEARNGLKTIENFYISKIETALDSRDLAGAKLFLSALVRVSPTSSDTARLKRRIAETEAEKMDAEASSSE